jgi:glyoxylase-like metal-dependent hydrolase (beta-lactamase superfamily II)
VRFGPYDVEVLRDGTYRLDGGAMFGVVPKVLWERVHPADEQNRVELGLNCLLLRSNERTILVDTGMGNGWSTHEQEIYALERPRGGLLTGLEHRGLSTDDVTDVVLTHLHFDHAGGCTQREGLKARPTFANATHWLQGAHLRWGRNPTDRDRRSFRSDTFEPLLLDEHRVQLVDGSREILPGLTVHVVNGHTPGQQVVRVGENGGPQLLFGADLLPFASHVHVPWIMAFDLNPLLTLEEKRELLARAALDDWTVVFGHEPRVSGGLVRFEEGRYRVVEEVQL